MRCNKTLQNVPLVWHVIEPGKLQLGNTKLFIKHVVKKPKLSLWQRVFYTFKPCFVVYYMDEPTSIWFNTLDDAKFAAKRMANQWIELGYNDFYIPEDKANIL